MRILVRGTNLSQKEESTVNLKIDETLIKKIEDLKSLIKEKFENLRLEPFVLSCNGRIRKDEEALELTNNAIFELRTLIVGGKVIYSLISGRFWFFAEGTASCQKENK